MTSYPSCGYCYIFHLVEPIARYGYAIPMKSNSINDIELTCNKLLPIAHHHPKIINMYDAIVQ
jgi:hypothetical protein